MKLKKYRSKKHRRGSILGLVVVIGMCLAILGWGMLQMGFGARLNSAISVSGITAREAADAGIAKAIYTMNLNFPNLPATGVDEAGTLDNSGASYVYRIEPFGENYLIKSTGISNRGQRVVYGVTGKTNDYNFAVIVSDYIELKQDSFIDAYDSNLGRYGVDGNERLRAIIGTTYAGPENRIFLRNNVVIIRDVIVGPGGDVDEIIWDQANPGATTGPRYAMLKIPAFPPIVVPDCGPSLGDFPFDEPIETIGQEGFVTYVKYDNIIIPNATVLNLLGQVYLHVLGEIRLNNGSQIVVNGVWSDPATWSSAMIFLDGPLTVGQGGQINNMTERPRNFWLLGTGTSPAGERWIINNSGNYYGIYKGPNATIDVRQSGVFYGGIIGKNFTLAQSSQVHYDEDLGLNAEDTGYVITRWWEE